MHFNPSNDLSCLSADSLLVGQSWPGTLMHDKVNRLSYRSTYPHKRVRKQKVAICSHQADSPHYVCDLVSDLVISVLKYDVYDVNDQVSLNITTSQIKLSHDMGFQKLLFCRYY